MCFGSLREDVEHELKHPTQPVPNVPPPVPHATKPAPLPTRSPHGPHKITETAIDVFLYSQQENGEMGGIGYWQTANAYHAIVLHETYAGQRVLFNRILPAMDKIASRVPHFINEFNDDTLWWAHCLLAIHPFVIGTPRQRWVNENLHAIWNHVSRYQLPPARFLLPGMEKPDMGGAVMWTSRRDEEQVNSITTGLFAALSARLAVLFYSGTALPSGSEQQKTAHRYIAAAEAGLGWILRECYRERDKVVLDGVMLRSGKRNNWTFTYTTAVTISSMVALATSYLAIPSYHKEAYAESKISRACDLAQASMRREQWVEPSTGILTEKGAYGRGSHDPWQNNDSVAFKSVLIRALCELRQTLTRDYDFGRFRDVRQEIDRFVETQFKALQERNTNGRGQYGPWWDGPFEAPTGHSQLAILDVMAGAHCVGCR
ncbi:uncharacterized protein N0V89_005008 [Didymosphaeria variabile]|uniref:Glycoside hydrolase family 76 protein n=1 Tax=Didymosphaeria variabile TaxID=1932322 RepID=A0A9W8XK92_9PLEO|nr:uncharacterized protein N0V89_005008 [Didymosphaeria variabile]KAJ4353281.1 hypothetical protein N0V89_005008 [Didymosphaeria variabile]